VAGANPLGPALLAFLTRLAAHNTREWFEAHRAEYERDVRAPLRALTEELDARIGTVAPEIVGDVRRSPLRISRDLRFSHDKTPYKRFAGLWLFHAGAGRSASMHANGGAAGFYLHLEPGASFVAGGMWMPPQPTLVKIRRAMSSALPAFEAALSGAPFTTRFRALDQTEMLTRLPRGARPGDPAERWLRHKSFTAQRPLTDAAVVAPDLVDDLTTDFAALTPLVRWLNEVIGYGARERR
jgi:uncharacterized protein (TIGR02453 family)